MRNPKCLPNLSGGNSPALDIHPYFAKFQSDLPRKIIRELTVSGDIVLDPFCGSGVSLTEALLSGRNAIGIDANPLACLISRVKIQTLSKEDVQVIDENLVLARELVDRLFDGTPHAGEYSTNLPYVVNFETWFKPHVIKELSVIRRLIDSIPRPCAKDFLSLAFSRIIVRVSNQHTESRYTRVDKKIAKKEPTGFFLEHAGFMKNCLASFHAQIPGMLRTQVFNNDSRQMDFIPRRSIDLIVTSPPYLNSWDYALYNRFRFVWLRYPIESYERIEIGKHLRALRNGRKELERYTNDMQQCLQEFSRVLRPGGHCCIVNSDSILDGNFIGTNQALITAGLAASLRLVKTIRRKILGPHFGMRASLKTKRIRIEPERNGRKEELILIFKKR